MPFQKLTTEDFITKAEKIHSNTYDYSQTIYTYSYENVNIICRVHGPFMQIAQNHLKGKGCIQCGIEKRTNKIKSTTKKFIEKSIKIHSDIYDYSQVNYLNNYTPVNIVCKEHGIFTQTPSSHLLGYGCQICSNKIQKTNESFIERAKEVHGDKYVYSNINYITGRDKIEIHCHIHGPFLQRAESHLSGRGCPSCKMSKGELKIKRILVEQNINFIQQHTFDNCIRIKSLKFDFYLPEFNTCIEFNGKQHYKPINHFGGDDYFKLIQERDSIKQDFCKSNNIKLIVIKFDDDINLTLNDMLISLYKHSPCLQHKSNL